MSKDGFTTEGNVIILRLNEKNKSRDTTNNQSLQHEDDFENQLITEQLDLIDESKDFDSDSGVSSLRRSRGKVATSLSGTNVTIDDELEDKQYLLTADSLQSETDQYRRFSNSSSVTNYTINKISSDFDWSSERSSHASCMNLPPLIPAAITANSKQLSDETSINTNVADAKEKHGLRKFLQKMFKPSVNRGNTLSSAIDPQKSQGLNTNLTHKRAYSPMSLLPITQGPIRLLVLRHGERLDRYYSSQWLRQAFDKDGNFCRFSPILPETLPFRDSIRDFDLDPPLTYRGLKDSYNTGTVLIDKNIHINYCYSSPALRCVQTAAKILEGLQLQKKMEIRIEPGLFECTGWYTASETSNVLTMPRFMTKKELLENKYVVDKNYREQMTITDISRLETELEFYERSHAVTTSILKIHESEYINQIQQGQTTPQQNVHILFVAHAPNLETCTRKLSGGKFRPETLANVIRNVDFLTMTVIEKTDNNCDKWIFRRSSFYGDEF